MRLSAVATALAACLVNSVKAGSDTHKYKDKEHVELWVNKVNIMLAFIIMSLSVIASVPAHHGQKKSPTARTNLENSFALTFSGTTFFFYFVIFFNFFFIVQY